MSLKKKLLLFLDLLGICALIALDQYTKYLAVIHLKDKPAYNIINGVLELNYLENKGAAFGMLQNQKAFFIFVAVVTLSVIGYVLFKVPDRKKYRILHLLLSLIAAGAIGNMIDRIRFDYVVDFIYFVLINFPIFNVADIYVTVSTVALVFLLLFVYKENDLSFISFKQKRYREVK
ncbi:MAG: signal peptidase II [Lachnospiraceae bacterium]|nr:signal peptidase II [Lachnospiraceae bacterium]MBD5525140.1 signal peptidase II [Lachnospiraceae bacterium]